jgi:hypothetical protein
MMVDKDITASSQGAPAVANKPAPTKMTVQQATELTEEKTPTKKSPEEHKTYAASLHQSCPKEGTPSACEEVRICGEEARAYQQESTTSASNDDPEVGS